MLTSLFTYLDDQRDSVIHWQKEMTSRPAIGPENNGEGEERKAIWLIDLLNELTVAHIHQIPSPDMRVPCGYRPNIAAIIPGKTEQKLWIIGHMDVVPPGERHLWDFSPYELQVDGDFVYGRGVEDNQQAIVSGLLVAKALLANNIVPDISLGLLFVSDEETGMTHGLPHVLQASPELISPADLVLVPDMGNARGSMIESVEKSCLWLRFTVHGKQCHASTPDMGINSLEAASACILALKRLYHRFPAVDPLFVPAWSTFVPSKKEANVENINTLPGKDIFYLDCRVLPEYPLDDVILQAQLIADHIAKTYRVQITIESIHKEQASEATPKETPVITALMAALQQVHGVKGLLAGSGGQTVASVLRKRGIPTAVWATLIPNPHTPNERSSITNTINDAKVMTAMLFQTAS